MNHMTHVDYEWDKKKTINYDPQILLLEYHSQVYNLLERMI